MAEAALSADDETVPDALQGLIATHAETRAFLRASPDRNEALVCVCTADTDLEQVFSSGREALANILASG